MSCSSIGTPRRYYLLKSQAARAACDTGLELVWRSKQRGEAGTDLPVDFPSLAALTAAYYTTVEDLTGALENELVSEARLTRAQATAVLAALAAL